MFESRDPAFNHQGEPRLVDLLNRYRIQRPFRLKTHLPLLLWFPIGLVVGFVRLVLFFLVAMPVLPVFHYFKADKLYWDYFMKIFGFVSHIENPYNYGSSEEAPIVVCNHCTDLDGVAFYAVLPMDETINITTVYLKPLVKWAYTLHFPLKVLFRETDPSRKHLLRENLLEALDEKDHRRLFVLAEGATTNNRVGLLQYQKFVFSLNRGIQPFSLHINPHIPINIDRPAKNMLPNFFWFFFCPYVTFTWTALPVVHRLQGETPEEFAKRVQKLTADSLDLQCTTYSYKDKNLLKRVTI